jgi:dTDP-4-amino-4,6-dideoxygalactose transaminase
MDLASWLGGLIAPTRAEQALAAAIRARYDVTHCAFMSSGRAALYLLLRTLRQQADRERDELVIPSYTCYSVPAAAIRAGLRVRVCDIDARTLSYDLGALEQVDFSRVLAIVSANLYGIPNDLPAIEAIARRHGVMMIDDAAQSMHARVGGRAVGTFGDVGLYSLDKGKNITSVQGGILVTRSPQLAGQLRSTIAQLPPASAARTMRESLQLLVYAAFLRPSLYWLPASLPILGLGRTVYTTEYPVERYSPRLAPLALSLFRRIDELTAHRIATARRLAAALSDIAGLQPIDPPTDAAPVFLRFPLLARNQALRDALVRVLTRERLGATVSYPLATLDIPEVQPHLSPGSRGDAGRDVARRILTLPTHRYVTDRAIAQIASLVRETVKRTPTP